MDGDGNAVVVIVGDGGRSRPGVPNTNWPLVRSGVVGKAGVP